MYIFHYKLSVQPVTGMNCVGLRNGYVIEPDVKALLEEDTGVKEFPKNRILKIAKVEVSSSQQSEVGLYQGEIQIVDPKQDVTSQVRCSDVEEDDYCNARAVVEPTLIEPATLLKSASIQDGQVRKLIDNSDYLFIPPGQSLIVRAVPSRVMQVIHITIVFDEIESAIL